ncbi:uncharacterized protein LOC131652524 [Vicia villosa]|uniref:uncharacterized protein LOC131652524 n=1 Tax=Vicia villosa TaxID=3911 RepID=UPI00273B4541|nr:uncharacterized protein LOC131652524 [Vicia villosa]
MKFTKNDKVRVRVRCKDGCQWEAYCSKFPNEETWQLRKLVDKHECSRDYNVKMMTTKWLRKRIQNSLKNNPRMKIKDIKVKAQRKWNMGVNKTKAIRVVFRARDMVDGSFLGDYTRIYPYCHEILRANLWSTVKLNVDPVPEGNDDQRPYFRRLYVCFAACKESFKLSIHIIGLDGCFLKGLCGVKILVAIDRNPNDQMLPIAFALVEGENIDNWTWFLQLLIDDLGGVYYHPWMNCCQVTNKCVTLLNNMSEAFNRVILESKSKPLVTMLEEIKTYFMERISDGHIFEVKHSRNFIFEDYIPQYYKKSRYVAVYKPVIYPVNGSNLWERVQYLDVHPPKYRKMLGRPMKKRNISQGEIDGTDRKIRRIGMILKCSRCKKSGHNKAICEVTGPAQPTQQFSQQPSQATSHQTAQHAAQPTQQSSQQPTQATSHQIDQHVA